MHARETSNLGLQGERLLQGKCTIFLGKLDFVPFFALYRFKSQLPDLLY